MSEELAQTMDLGAGVDLGTDTVADVAVEVIGDEETGEERRDGREEVIAANPEVVGIGITEVHQETPIDEERAEPVSAPVLEESTSSPALVASTVVAEQTTSSNASVGSGAEAEVRAAEALRDAYRAMPGVVADLVRGSTVEEVKASFEAAQRAYNDIKAAVLREQGVAVPPAHGGSPAVQSVPGDPLSMILAGVVQPKR